MPESEPSAPAQVPTQPTHGIADRVGALLPWAIPLLAVASTVHVVLTLLDAKGAAGFEVALWVLATALLLPSHLGLAVLTARVHAVIFHDRRRALLAWALWVGLPALGVVLLAATRATWAPLVTTNSVRYYFVGHHFRASTDVLEHSVRWARDWQQGYVLVSELGFLLGAAALQALAGWAHGDRPNRSCMMGCSATIALLFAYAWWSPWLLLDYDTFHGEIYSGALLLSVLVPLAADPYTAITSMMQCLAATACVVLLRTRRGDARRTW